VEPVKGESIRVKKKMSMIVIVPENTTTNEVSGWSTNRLVSREETLARDDRADDREAMRG
jgi:hypothetical protein